MNQYDINGLRFSISMPKRHRRKHQSTCFRPNNLARAGNFSEWRNIQELLEDELIGAAIAEIVHDLLVSGYRTRERFSIMHPHTPVGWSTTAPQSYAFREGHRGEMKHLNSRLRVLSVTNRDVLAPKTCVITVALHIGQTNGRVPVMIEEVFPGLDPGPPTGDKTEIGRVFFKHDHPGGDVVLEDDIFWKPRS